jgi:hypothetical protein
MPIGFSDGSFFKDAYDAQIADTYSNLKYQERLMESNLDSRTGPEEDTQAKGLTKNVKPQKVGDVVPFPIYPGLDMDRRIGMDARKRQAVETHPDTPAHIINKAFDDVFGGGAEIKLGPGASP